MDLHAANRPVEPLHTARLMLRALSPDDLPWVCAVCNNYGVSKWLVMVPHPYTMSDAKDFLAMDQRGELGSLWIICQGGVPKGVISCDGDLGYWLDPAAWGQGIMTEAGTAVVAALFSDPDRAEIRSSHFVENNGSRRVLEKLGFQDVGALLHFSKARQANVPGRSMQLTRERWQTLRNVAQ